MNKNIVLKILGLDFGSKLEAQFLEWAYLFLRVVVPLIMLCSHGFGKLTGFSNIAPHFPDPLGLGSTLSLALVVGAEFFGSIFLALGLLTRWSSFSLMFTMLVAALIVHWPEPFKEKEHALLFALVFFLFTVAGGGKYSLDTFLKKKLNKY